MDKDVVVTLGRWPNLREDMMSPSVMPPARERALRKQDIMLTMIWGIIHRKRRNATHILSTGDTNLEQQLGERSLQRRLVTGG